MENIYDSMCLPAQMYFFNDKMADMPVTAERVKNHYCLGNNVECARFMVFNALGRELVPPDLFPQNIERARVLIKAAGK